MEKKDSWKDNKAIIVFIVALVSFLLLEQTTRFFLFGFRSFNYFRMNSVHYIGVSGLIKPSPFPGVIYELKPNLNTYFKMARFKTNSQGLRDKEYTIEKPQDTFRVVVLGDSFTMPSGVDIEDAFHTILEDRLNAESSGISYEFINFGVGGYDPKQYLATLKYKAIKYDPDLILFCLSKPFEYFLHEKHFKQRYEVKPRTYPFFKSFFVELANRTKIVSYFKNKFTEVDEKSKSEKIRDAKYRSREKTEDIFSELQAIGKKRNIPICIVILQQYYDQQKEVRELKELAVKYELYVTDTSAPFKGARQPAFYIYKLDSHPNAEAHKLFAKVIDNYLKQQHLLGNYDNL